MPSLKILCLSANPGLDRRLRLKSLSPGEILRAQSAEPLPGGKAAHVAMSARALGADASWLGFLGGAIGEEVAAGLRLRGIAAVAIPTATQTRVNLEIIEDSGRITEILEPGGRPNDAEQKEMLRVLEEGLRGTWKETLLAISGSLPAGSPPDFYARLIHAANAAGAKVWLDTSGTALAPAVAAGPFLVKVNRHEAEDMLGRPVGDAKAAVDVARKLMERGAMSAAITLGAEGLVWVEHPGAPARMARPPRLQAKSTVGCGDATLAGFVCAAGQGLRGDAALRLAAASGVANCLAEFTGGISAKDVESLLPRIELTTL
ncbi:MAG: 1-phosphofructokinase family hexose kinase [Candidatus Acidiferrales bacterium]